MTRVLLIIGGVLNTVFFLFHLLLGYQIHNLTQVAPPLRGLMEALNVGGVLFIFFFAIASFFCQMDLVQTRLGRLVLALIAVLYLSRACEEFIIFKFTPTIFAACAVTGLIYFALLLISWTKRGREELVSAVTVEHEPEPELVGHR